MGFVLLVGDDPWFHAPLSLALCRRGHGTLEATDAADALVVLRFGRPSVILLDLGEQKPDGLCVLRMLRQSPEWSEVPVIVLAALAGPQVERARLLGAALVLLKRRVSLEQVVAHVETLTERNQASTAAAAA